MLRDKLEENVARFTGPLLELEKSDRVSKKDWVENGTDVIVTTKTLKTWKFSLRKMGVF